jgi:serine/threonine-protein kinase RsbW
MGSVLPNQAAPCLRVSFQLSALLECRAVAVDLVLAVIAHVPLADRMFRHEMITAFGEAFNNIVAHGYRGRTDGMIDVEAEIRPGELVLRLKDGGVEVDYGSIAVPDLESMPESGMGVYLMHSMVDEVAYTGGPLNVLSLTKRMVVQPSSSPDHAGPDQS